MNRPVYTGTLSVCLGSICGTAIITMQTQVTIQVFSSLFLPRCETTSEATDEIKYVLGRYWGALSDDIPHEAIGTYLQEQWMNYCILGRFCWFMESGGRVDGKSRVKPESRRPSSVGMRWAPDYKITWSIGACRASGLPAEFRSIWLIHWPLS